MDRIPSVANATSSPMAVDSWATTSDLHQVVSAPWANWSLVLGLAVVEESVPVGQDGEPDTVGGASFGHEGADVGFDGGHAQV